MIPLKRHHGTRGTLSCQISTSINNDIRVAIGDKDKARPYVDYSPITKKQVTFEDGQDEELLEIILKDQNMSNVDGTPRNLSAPCCFMLDLSEPAPRGTQLSRRTVCIVEIGQGDETDEFKVTPEARQNILTHFLKIRDPTFGERFKLAVQLGPMIDEYDVIDPVTCEETCMHFFSMPWKIMFAFIPASNVGGGWPTLILGLGVMVAITYVISELSTAIGCLLNMCTAI
jgi:hypothetical protein